jgi:hypothetical protein
MLLNVVDLRTRTDAPVLASRSMIPDEVITCMVPVIRRGDGAVAPDWKFRREREFFIDPPQKPPGSAFPSGHEVKPGPVVLGGIRFSLAHDLVGKGLTAWVAWRAESVIEAVKDDIIETIDRHREALGSLCPFEEPVLEPTLPLLAVLRMPAWRDDRLAEERVHLEELQARVGWSVVEALSS